MSPRACFQVALKALAKNKLQTALTAIGLTIGVATVLTMFALGSGAQFAIEDQVRAAGMTLITVSSGHQFRKTTDDPGTEHGDQGEFAPTQASASPFRNAVRRGTAPARLVLAFSEPEANLGTPATLTLGDAAAIRTIPGVQYVSEGVHTNVNLLAGPDRVFTRLHGEDASLPSLRRAWKFEHGRYYTRAEQQRGDRVMVLGSITAGRLFGKANPVGGSVTLWNQAFQVVGVVGSGSWLVAASAGDDQFDAAYIPFTTMQQLLHVAGLSDITLTAATAGDVARVTKAVTALIRQRHHIDATQADDFAVFSQAGKVLARGGMRPEVARAMIGNMYVLDKVTLDQFSKTLEKANRTMTALLASIAAVSLLVGGIGIMNTMLLSVTERTNEIGIRRAVGARSRDVLLQFLMEAATLSVLGGIAGIVLGVVVSIFITRWAAWSTHISGISVAVSFGVATAVGIFFGYYPARQASRVDPMESLRYE